MGQPQISAAPQLFLQIAGGPNIGELFEKFEWKSFTNGGYIIRAKMVDPYWNILKNVATQFYLNKGRRSPTQVIFEIQWPGNKSTGKQQAYMTDLDAKGINAGGKLEFIAVDPPSFWLNAGDASGRVFKGTVKQVIQQVIQTYFIDPNGEGSMQVSDTLDSNQNRWWMMRMDPKTFIASLLDWSSSITEGKTNWIVSSGGSLDAEPQIWVMEQSKRKTINYGLYTLDIRAPGLDDIYNFEFLADNFISVFQKQIITQGISSVSGRYFDREMDPQRKIVHVYDENTSQKKNTKFNQTRGFTKPEATPSPEAPHDWSTSIMAVPEFNGGDLGVTYDKYIDGRGRAMFLNMLNLVMRVKIRVTGEPSRDLANSHNLGVSKLKIAWQDADNTPYFMDGDWLVYGFHHIVSRQNWVTDIYCARLDWNSSAIKV